MSPREAGPGPSPRRRRRWTTWIPLAAVVLVVLEVWLLVQLAHLLGGGWVLLLLLAETAGGLLVLRRAGRRALEAFRQTSSVPFGAPVPGQDPGVVGDAVLTGLGGVLLVVPGVLSDVLGLLCVLPPTRRLLRRAFVRLVRRRVERVVRRAGGTVPGRVVPGDVAEGDVVDGEVVDGEVVDDPRELGR
ncbi:FxsA family protein [Kineococcus sp. LSe6-4]|uniref:FxsA family protein n=1 Tax=Kineococcus halophytocola TaxID=3234027 RepID=A0ABV4GZ85_9ACTN